MGYGEHDDKTSGCIKHGEYFKELNNKQRLKKHEAYSFTNSFHGAESL
jgi:hypothetical protein